MESRVTDLPPWSGDDEAMLRWLNDILDQRLWEEQDVKSMTAEQYAVWRTSLIDPAMAAAWSGDMEPLRKRFPKLEPFLHPAKLRRGDKRPKRKCTRETFLHWAAEDVDRIRELWQLHYGRKKRRRGQTSAETFAGKRWSEGSFVFDGDDVARAHKPSGTPRKARAK
jgi:hypothetical protein